jgi:hypothetical protein
VTPSDRARELVRGAFDLHVHVAPDVMERRIDDVSLARRFAELDLGGFALKSHYTSTAERAAVVSKIVPEVRVLGALALNHAVGGLNGIAVEIAAREGARIVWFPTVDAASEAHAGHAANPPAWFGLQRELQERGFDQGPVRVAPDGELVPEARAVLARIAEHGLVLATGHLDHEETSALVDAALDAGVAHVVVTHPDFPAQDFSVAQQVAFADRGALIERCFTTAHTGKVSWESWLACTRAVGAQRCMLSTDLGQTANPPVEDGLALMADRLLEDGFTEEEVHTMAVTNTRRLAGAAA